MIPSDLKAGLEQTPKKSCMYIKHYRTVDSVQHSVCLLMLGWEIQLPSDSCEYGESFLRCRHQFE